MKRYFVDGIDCHWQEHPEGWWVGYDEAEAEIARLTAERDQKSADFNNELQEMSERFRAVNLVECAKLYDKDVQRELSEAKAEIARLQDDCDYWKGQAMTKEERFDRQSDEIYHLTTERDEWHLRCELAQAEIARLRDGIDKVRLGDFERVYEMRQALRALKPDTGEKP